MTELRDLLEAGAGTEPAGFTTTDVERRVRRRIRRRRVASGIVGAAVLLVVGAASWMVTDRDDDLPVATEGSGDERVRDGSTHPGVELSRGGWVAVEHSDWTQPTEGLGHAGRTTIKFHEGLAQGQLLCNTYGARWRVEGSELVVDEMLQSLVGCEVYEERVAELLTGRPRIEWSAERPDELTLRDGEGHIRFERIDPWFEVLDMREAAAPIGSLAVAETQEELLGLVEAKARLTEDEQEVGPGFRPVDFDRWVVVSIVIPDDLCPPTLDRLEGDGSLLTPVFVQPPGACRSPLIPRVFFIAIDRAGLEPGFTFRYPAEDPLLQHSPPMGPYEDEIRVDVEPSDGAAG